MGTQLPYLPELRQPIITLFDRWKTIWWGEHIFSNEKDIEEFVENIHIKTSKILQKKKKLSKP